MARREARLFVVTKKLATEDTEGTEHHPTPFLLVFFDDRREGWSGKHVGMLAVHSVRSQNEKVGWVVGSVPSVSSVAKNRSVTREHARVTEGVEGHHVVRLWVGTLHSR